MGESDISVIIQKDRQERVKEHYEGTFLDYAERVKKDPNLAILSHQRIYNLISKAGTEMIKTDAHHRLRRIYVN